MKLKLSLVVLLAVFLLAACQNDDGSANQQSDEELKALVHEYSISDQTEPEVVITGTELIVTETDGEETRYSLPDDEFFVSIAPFINYTHPCTYHSLSGCQSELVEEELDVYIEDNEGNVVLEEKMTTLANGFIDLWLPRDETYQITINYQDQIAEAELSTFDQDATCITTMQLT